MALLRIVVALLVIVPSSAVAQPAEQGWTLRFGAALIHSSASHETELSGDAAFRGEAESGWGATLGGEYRFNSIVGLEPSIFVGQLDADFVVTDGAEIYRDGDRLGMRAFSLAVDLHLIPNAGVDLYIAPSVSWIDFGDMEGYFPELDLREPLTAGDDVAPGLALGLDLPFGDGGWAFSARLRFWKAESVETDNPPWRAPIRVDVDPLILELVAAYRF
jgi:hypothetical protein